MIMHGRRAALALICAGGVAAVIAGCTSSSSGGGAPSATRTVTPPTTASPSSARTASPSSPTGSAAPVTVIDRSGRDEAGFTSPSGHIACMFLGSDGGSLTCEINQKSWSPPPKPAKCKFDWAYGIRLDAGARSRPGFYCGSDTIRGDPRAGTDGSVVLGYGSAMRFGPFTCTSQRSGVDCVNTTSKAGFLLSRERYQLRNP
jgi:hypothetical protein